MTANKEQADKYIKMMWAIVSINLAILGFVVTMFLKSTDKDLEITQDLEHLKNWTNEVYRWEIMPTQKRSEENEGMFIIVFKRLDKIDSANYFQDRRIHQLYDWERERRGMPPMNGYD